MNASPLTCDLDNPLVETYTDVLDTAIPESCLSELGFASKQELVATFFVDSVEGTFKEELDEQGIADAFRRSEFVPTCLSYRSIDDITGPPTSGEFLARRFVPQRGISGTRDWLRAVESSGRGAELDEIALYQGGLVAASMPNFSSSSNVSGDFLRCGDMPERVESALASTNAHPQNIHLEILENISALTAEDLATIKRLSEIGVQICIDDCDVLRSKDHMERILAARIPIHTLKIDNSLTASILAGPEKVLDWGRRADQIGVRKVVFEGGPKTPLTPDLIDLLRQARETISGRAHWYVEGLIYPNTRDN